MINLYVSYYIDPRPDRAKEIDACLKTNLASGHFDTATIYTDVPAQELAERFAGLTAGCNVIFNHDTPRPTFAQMFDHARSMTGSMEVVHVFANSDIVFDSTIIAGAKTITTKQAFALTRWDMTVDHRAVFMDRVDSQDVLMLKGVIADVPGANFTQGAAGCDNKIAFLLKQAGYKVLNPSKDIRTYHMHLSGVRNYSIVKDRKEIKPPFLTVPPCRLNDCK
jgi:hypothetical protein